MNPYEQLGRASRSGGNDRLPECPDPLDEWLSSAVYRSTALIEELWRRSADRLQCQVRRARRGRAGERPH